jgi:hypothetical protein
VSVYQRFYPEILLVLLFLLHTFFFYLGGIISLPRMRVIGVDPICYFSYLHTLFFDRDLDFENEYRALDDTGVLVQYPLTPLGRRPNGFSVGPALAVSPFYLTAHALLKLTGSAQTDGLSPPYQVSCFWGIVWKRLYGQFLTVPQGGGFLVWTRPRIWSILFSTFNGLFSWTPICLLGVLGLFPGIRDPGTRRASCLLLILFLLQLYVNSAVFDWHGSWGFGMRRFMDCLPIFVLGISSLLKLADRKKNLPFPPSPFACSFFGIIFFWFNTTCTLWRGTGRLRFMKWSRINFTCMPP